MAVQPNDLNVSPEEVQPGQELWRHPDPKSTQMWDFLQSVNKQHNLSLNTYDDLYPVSYTHLTLPTIYSV